MDRWMSDRSSQQSSTLTSSKLLDPNLEGGFNKLVNNSVIMSVKLAPTLFSNPNLWLMCKF